MKLAGHQYFVKYVAFLNAMVKNSLENYEKNTRKEHENRFWPYKGEISQRCKFLENRKIIRKGLNNFELTFAEVTIFFCIANNFGSCLKSSFYMMDNSNKMKHCVIG